MSKKDLYDELWRCRDLEINSLWQKSVFLGSFIIAVGTVYCAFIGKLLSGEIKAKGLIALWGDCCISVGCCLHLAAFAIAFVEIALSMLWIFMAKGSKYWVEVFETSLQVMIHDKLPDGKFRIETEFNKDDYPVHGNLNYPDEDGRSKSVFTTDACRCSPSRINVMIGIIFLVLFSVFAVFNMACAMNALCGRVFCTFAVSIAASLVLEFFLYKVLMACVVGGKNGKG